MANPQIIFFRDLSGRLHAEAPGAGSSPRRKIDLPAGKPLEEIIHEELDFQTQLAASKPEPIPTAASGFISQRQAEARAAGEQRIRELPEWRKQQLRELCEEADRRRASQIWLQVASSHDIPLANRVISDPARRPSRRVIVYGQDGTRTELSPRQQQAINGANMRINKTAEELDL